MGGCCGLVLAGCGAGGGGAGCGAGRGGAGCGAGRGASHVAHPLLSSFFFFNRFFHFVHFVHPF